jgi:Uma2 family endonuclease
MALLTSLEQLKRIPMTHEEFEALPEGPPYYDYVDGVAIEANRPSLKHQRIILRGGHALDTFVAANKLGLVAQEVSLELPDGTFYGPDILFIAKNSDRCRVRDRGDVIGVPDLVVEVLSPTTESYDQRGKMTRYHRAGVPWVWIIGQDDLQADEYRWTEEGYTLILPESLSGPFRPKLFPGFELDLPALLDDLSPVE